jgi:hypothetical protein
MIRRELLPILFPIRAMGGGGGGPPEWVLTADDQVASMDVDFVGDQAWLLEEMGVADLIACSRNQTSYYTNASGILVPFSADSLRYGDRGALVENAGTNLSHWSQQLKQADSSNYWVNSGGTMTTDATAAPDGSMTAELFVENSSGGVHYFCQDAGIARTAVQHVLSVYLKPRERTRFSLHLIEPVIFTHHGCRFLCTGGGSVTGTTGTITASGIEALANGWYRCWISRTLSTGDWFIRVSLIDADGALPKSYTGDGTSGAYAWGVQLEVGAKPTSYIPTFGGASSTRPAEVVTFSDLTWWGGSANSIYAEWLARNTNNAVVWAFDATNDKVLDEQTGMSARIAGATVANTAAADSTVKAAARLSLNDFAISMNGGAVATDGSETDPGTLAAARLGLSLAGANGLDGHIRRVAAWGATGLANGVLQSLST